MQHPEHIGRPHLPGNLLLQIHHLHVKVVLHRQLDALRQVDLLAFHHITIFGRFEVLDRILRTLIAVVLIALASTDRHHTGNGSRTPQTKQNLIRFLRGQKIYPYRYGDEWGLE